MKETNPKPSSDAARNRMKAAKPKDTRAELQLRTSLEKYGIEFEIDVKPIEELNRRADILFRKEKIAVFVDGCFWHGCPIHGTQAKANAEFWSKKIERNKVRDADTNEKLKEHGWKVIRVWEHEDSDDAAKNIIQMVENIRNEAI